MRPGNQSPIWAGKSFGWWRRLGTPRSGFRYVDLEGRPLKEPEALRRIKELAIPPAWKEVRISPSPGGRLQALGVDGGGRTQYLYHPSFVAKQQKNKFERIERFGDRLGFLRRTLENHLELNELSRERVIATILRLMDGLYFRVGSERGARKYHTYGVTTLRRRHVKVGANGRLTFNFTGKHHIRARRMIVDESVARALRELLAAPGGRLFKFIGDDGRYHAVQDRDVNDYMQAAVGPDFSAKDLRTWAGTLLAARELAAIGKPHSEREAKRNITQAVRAVADQLGNTPAVCRESYIHPGVLEEYADGVLLSDFSKNAEEESALLLLLQEAHSGPASSNGSGGGPPPWQPFQLAAPILTDALTVP